MNELKIFDEREVLGKQFRIYGTPEEPLFLAGDVAEWIEYSVSNVSKMISTVDNDEKVRNNVTTLGGVQEAWFLTEDGLYEVLMQSRKPIAKQFKKKVKEILRDIRRHGAYMTDNTLDRMIASPEFGIKLLTTLKEEKEKRKALEIANSELAVDNQIMKPKADYFDDLVDRNLLTNFRDTAKQLGLKERKFINFLLDHKYIYRDRSGKLKPYANKNDGLFELKEFTNEKSGYTSTQTMITPKGREAFRLLCLPALM